MLSKDRFENHELWPALGQARTHMDANTHPDETSENDALIHIGAVLELLERRRLESDPAEITPTMLNAVTGPTQTLAQQIEAVNSQTSTWSQIVGFADAVLDALASWPPLKPRDYLEGLSSASSKYQDKVAQALDDTGKRADVLSGKLDDLSTKQDGLETSIADERQRITEAVAEFETTSAEWVLQVRNEQAEQLAALLAEWKRRREHTDEDAQQTLERLHALETEASNVVQAATSHIVATDYGRYARNKTVAAWVCDIAAALVGAVGVGVMVFHLLSMDPEADANVGLSLTRVAVSLGTLGIATLIGRRGQQHHLEARAAKRTDLALRQVLPFTANLDQAERQAIVKEFTERVFIRGDLDSPNHSARGFRLGRESTEVQQHPSEAKPQTAD